MLENAFHRKVCKIDGNNWCLIMLIILFKTSICHSEKNFCVTEYSLANKTVIKWEMKGNINNQIISSQPPCVDKNNTLITRICSDAKWFPSTAPTCDNIGNYNKVCPDPFILIDDQCVFITQPRKWQDNCHLPIRKNEISATNVLDAYFWLPIKRLISFGPFEYASFVDKYGEVTDKYKLKMNDKLLLFQNDCLVYNTLNKTVQPENCDNLHQHVCNFDPDFKFYYCPKPCRPGGIGNAKCYCKIKGQNCEQFAVVDSWFDRKLLGKIADDNICRIADSASSFTDRGFHSYLSANNWFYSNSTRFNYSICESRVGKSEVTEMILSFEEKSRELYLLVYSPENILVTEEDSAIYCFTDASEKLRKKIKTKIVFDSDDNDYSRRSIQVHKLKLEKLMGNYWCEAFDLNLNLLHSNKVIAYRKKEGNEYALRIIIRDVCKHYNCGDLINLSYENFIDDSLEKIFKPLKSKIRVMEIFHFNIATNIVDILFHISTGRKRIVTEEYYKYKSELMSNFPNYMTVVYFKCSEFCLPEKTQLANKKLHWPLTKIGKVVTSLELCLTEYQIPATRVCDGNFLYGHNWSKIKGYCSETTSVSDYTKYLYENINANITNFIAENITDIANKSTNLSVLDIYYLEEIFAKIRETWNNKSQDVTNVFEIVDKLMEANKRILKQSKFLLNATDEILDLIDDILSDSTFNTELIYLIQKRNVIVHVTKPFLSNVTGIILYGKNNSFLTDFTVKSIKRNESLDNIELNDLQLAIYISDLVLEEIEEHFVNNTLNVYLIITIFLNDSLFIDEKHRSVSNVISVNIPGYGSYLKSPVSMLIKSETAPEKCAFWDYGKKTQRKRGEWSTTGNTYLENFSDNNLYVCSFIHLTHFALLITSGTNIVDEHEIIFYPNADDNHDFILNLITVFGGCLSLFGIGGIFLTAAFFEQWRRKIGTRILMNLSLAILMETISIHLSEIDSIVKSENGCKMLGIFLHYVILSKFCWMLIYAFLQYLRFVKVIGLEPQNLILKSVIIGWGVPVIPVLAVGLTSPDNYTSTTYQLCYPRGLYFYLGILLPILLIILANLVVFCLIMYRVTRKNVIARNHSSSAKLQFYLAILLFFMLGLPWVFGILAELISYMHLKIILFYMFCITATLQGFVMFLFYVILNNETRNKWAKYIKTKKKC